MGRGGGSTHNKVVTVEVHELMVNARKLACFKHSDSVDLVSSYNFWDNLEVGSVQVREQVKQSKGFPRRKMGACFSDENAYCPRYTCMSRKCTSYLTVHGKCCL